MTSSIKFFSGMLCAGVVFIGCAEGMIDDDQNVEQEGI